ncbi:PEP-CTERM sorting domain-containing protein [Coraliomargarita parva]|uniref:PEP-CTERM sorting domain-containing protein n=1 Tax=Coraliomargarita parva TaxID=3014050 RepID=UPI0022B5B914|nr:PEP-CTERM sorting domain-containing protein [Coraliomargarita parva]
MKQSLEKTSAWLILGSLSLLPLSSNASIIATESFDYADGNNNLASVGTGGTGWSAGWTTDGTSFDVVDGAAFTGEYDTFRNSRTLTSAQSTGTLYIAWTGVKQRTVDEVGTQVLALSGMSGTTEEFSLQFRTDYADVDSEYFLLYGGSDRSDSASATDGPYTEGTEVTFVLEIVFDDSGNEAINAWAFSGGLPTILGSASLTQSAPITSIDSILIQSNGKSMTGYFDNIVIATEYSDILSVIPEPSTYAVLFGIATLTLAFIRRRRA